MCHGESRVAECVVEFKTQEIITFKVNPCARRNTNGCSTEFKIHRSRLIENSTYWRDRLNRPAVSSSVEPVPIGADPTVFALFAHWLYDRTLTLEDSQYLSPSTSVNTSDYYKLCKAAELYKIEKLRRQALFHMINDGTGTHDIIKIIDVEYKVSSQESTLKTLMIEHIIERKDDLDVIAGLGSIEACKAICAAIWKRSSFNQATPN